MKKIINISLILLVSFWLSSCFFTNKDQVNQAKQDLGIIEDTLSDTQIEQAKEEMKNEETVQEETKQEEVTKVETPKNIEIQSLTSEQFIQLDDLSKENLLDGEVEITGTTTTKVDKIIVNFSNATSDFPEDRYTLKQFTPGSESFLYRAFSRYETLDFGKNIYLIEAYSWDKVSKLQLTLNVVKQEEQSVEEKVEQVFEDISINALPVGANYGSPVELWDGKFTYSDIKGLEILRDVLPELSECNGDTLTEVLTDKINAWFFWNTCRPIETDEWISVFVVRLDGDEYVYEKHYYLSYEWIYWVQELERWTWVTNQNIWEKNKELKEKNEQYTILEVVDSLFVDILK